LEPAWDSVDENRDEKWRSRKVFAKNFPVVVSQVETGELKLKRKLLTRQQKSVKLDLAQLASREKFSGFLAEK
jgi:chromosome condensin MukBEF complex kleisin-like MukF subunit